MSTFFTHYVIINACTIQSFSNMSFMLLSGAIVLLICLILNSKIRPTRIEIIIGVLGAHWQEVSSMETVRKQAIVEWMPLFSLFSLLFLLNVLGFILYSFPITAHFSLTIGLAFMVWLCILISSLYAHWPNPEGVLLNFMPKGAPVFMAPALVIIEIISYCIRPLSLGLRLGANITAGHLLLGIIANFTFFFVLHLKAYCWILPVLLLISMVLLELVVLAVQAYVFTLLTTIYLAEGKEIH